MKLLTQEIRKKLPPLYSTEKLLEHALVQVKFFDPTGSFTWYATEFDGQDTFFGVVTSSICPRGEYGTFSLSELESVRVKFGLRIERDLHFTPKTLLEVVPQMFTRVGSEP